MQVKGTIKRIEATKVVSDKFKKRDVVVTTDGEYSQDLNIQFTQNKCDVLNNYTAGDNVVIDINLRGNDRENADGVVSNFTKIEGWKISKSEIY